MPLAPALDLCAGALPLAGGPFVFAHLRAIAISGGRPVASWEMPSSEIASWLAALPPQVRERAEMRLDALKAPRPPVALAGGGRPLGFSRPLVMGILNVTPDSFSDGGRFADPARALARAQAMIAAGADIIDVGGESTRPGATPVWEEEELDRILPVLAALKEAPVPISVDTRHARVMEAALDAGAAMINDVSALTHDPDSLAVVAARDCPVILMHARGDPQRMQDNPVYEDVLTEVFAFLDARIRACEAAGIARERLIVDPGIGFGKTLRHNLTLLNGLAALHALGAPLLVGVSRKRFIGALSREEVPERRLAGSLAAALAAVDKGVQVLRVHDVAETVQALAVRQGLIDGSLMDRAAMGAP